MRYYRPGVGWWPDSPAPSGGNRKWNSADEVLDWSSGLVAPRKLAELQIPMGEGKKKYKRPVPGLRVRTLKSSATNKYHINGPYHGAKLRKWTKDKYKRQIEVLPDVYVVSGINGRYEYSEVEDRYEWLTD